jgi:hypothetical protein
MAVTVLGEEKQKMKLIKGKIKAIAALIFTAGLLGVVHPAMAIEQFDNQGIQFDEDTVIDFEFLESHGAYKSSFGVIDLDSKEKTPLLVETKTADLDDTVHRRSDYEDNTENQKANDFLGTPGNTVAQPFGSFTFKAGKRYALYLESDFNNKPAGIVYSNNLENPAQSQQTKFIGDLAKLGKGGVILRWNDTGSQLVKANEQDVDFDDFSIGVGGGVKCPEASAK